MFVEQHTSGADIERVADDGERGQQVGTVIGQAVGRGWDVERHVHERRYAITTEDQVLVLASHGGEPFHAWRRRDNAIQVTHMYLVPGLQQQPFRLKLVAHAQRRIARGRCATQ